MKLEDWKGSNDSDTCYIIGSGKSLDFIDDSFFDGKITIGVNRTFYRYRLDYLVVHHHMPFVKDAIENHDMDVFISKYDRCINLGDRGIYPEPYYEYEHEDQSYMRTNFNPIENPQPNKILTGGTTVVNAIGLAYWMGFKNIVLCGCDGKVINGEVNYKGYYDNPSMAAQKKHAVNSKRILTEVQFYMKQKGINILHLEAHV